jgi:hypothetical protein
MTLTKLKNAYVSEDVEKSATAVIFSEQLVLHTHKVFSTEAFLLCRSNLQMYIFQAFLSPRGQGDQMSL